MATKCSAIDISENALNSVASVYSAAETYNHRGHRVVLSNRMPVIRRIPPCGIVLELPLDVIQQSTDTEAEQLSFHPRGTEFLFHHRQPIERLLRVTNATGWLKSDSHSGLLRILANRTRHDQADWKRGICGLFSC